MDIINKKLIICGQEFEIINNELISSLSSYEFTDNSIELFQKTIDDSFDDYYLERVFKFIVTKFKNIDHLLEGSEEILRYTNKIKKVIENCCNNPEGEVEYQILELFTMIDIDWIKYVNKLNELKENLLIIYTLTNHEIPNAYISGKVYEFDYFSITFDKYNFDVDINVYGNAALRLKAMRNVENIDFMDYEGFDYTEATIFIEKQKYETFDSVVKYLHSLVENA